MGVNKQIQGNKLKSKKIAIINSINPKFKEHSEPNNFAHRGTWVVYH